MGNQSQQTVGQAHQVNHQGAGQAQGPVLNTGMKTPEERKAELEARLKDNRPSELDLPQAWANAFADLKPLLGMRLMLGDTEVDVIRQATLVDDKQECENRLTYKSGYFTTRQGQKAVYRFIQVFKNSFIPPTILKIGPWELTMEYSIKARILDPGKVAQVRTQRVSQALDLTK